MRKATISLLILIILLSAAAVWMRRELNQLTVVRVTDDLHMIAGAGSNVGVLKTSEGTVLVDTMTWQMQGKKVRAIAEDITGQPVVMIINTHYHLDHTHGNPAFAPGIRIISTEQTLQHLQNRDAGNWTGEAALMLPNETFETEKTVRIGGKTLRLIHPGRGHTDGDLVVLFEEDRSIHFGDLLFNELYPNIDLEAGGSVQNWSQSLEAVVDLPFEHVIPGHGDVTDRQGVRRFQDFIEQLAEIGRDAAAANRSLEDTLAGASLDSATGFKEIEIIVPVGIDRDFVIRRAWEEATAAVTAD